MEKKETNINTKEYWNDRFFFENKSRDEMLDIFNRIDGWEGDILDFAPFLKELNKKNEKMKILDVGGGIGAASERARKIYLNGDFYSLDISESAYKICSELFPEIKPVLSTMEKIPFNDEYFDIIFCIQAIEHCDNIEKTIFEIFRVLKHHGIFMLSFPYNWPADADHTYRLDDFFVNLFLKYGKILEYKESENQYNSKVLKIFKD